MSRRSFWAVALVHAGLWTSVSALLRPAAGHAAIEMHFWGSQWMWGSDAHPPLAAWLGEAGFLLAGRSTWGIYMITQLCVVTCFWAAYEVARDLMPATRAAVAALLPSTLPYFNLSSPEINPNVALATLWALATLCYWRAVRTGRDRWWMLLGVSFGLGLLAKYAIAFLGATMCAWLLATAEGRQRLRARGPYLAALIALLVTAPHIAWLTANDYPPIRWAVARSAGNSAWTRLVSPLGFAALQVAVLAPLLWVARPLGKGFPRLSARPLLSALVFGPTVSMLFVALLLGLQLRSLWATPLFTFFGTWLLAERTWGADDTRRGSRRFLVVAASLLIVAVGQQTLSPFVTGRGTRSQFPAQRAVARIEQIWGERFSAPVPFIGGRVYLAGQLTLYTPASTRAYSWDWPWRDDAVLVNEGGVFVWETGDGDFAGELLRRFPGLELSEPELLPWQTAAHVDPVELRFALLEPGGGS